jgi:cell wall-associated NlpC family hydrolase
MLVKAASEDNEIDALSQFGRVDGPTVTAAARRWVGTPKHHHGARRGVACDCLGLIVGVGREFGLLDRNARGYSPNPDEATVIAECEWHLAATEAVAEVQAAAFDYPGGGLIARGRFLVTDVGSRILDTRDELY